jgi:very-short-patch-repair endonuclease
MNFRIGQLQELAASMDPAVISQVLDELEHRDSAGAKELHASIERRLRGASITNQIEPSGPFSTDPRSSGASSVAKVIAAARQKLLDLTRRNRLVHFGPGNPDEGKTTADSLVLMGNAGAAWDQLVTEERTRDILILTEQEQAEAIGSLRSGDVETEIAGHALSIRTRQSGSSKSRSTDDIAKRLQTYIAEGGLISPLPLKASTAKLLTIYRKQETLESSTGDSCLFLAIGFLDWEIEEGPSRIKVPVQQEPEGPKRTRVCSPLILVHVKLKRLTPPGGGDLKFTIEMDADEAQGNPCLIQKFKSDQRLTLPDYDSEKYETWSDYIGAITQAVSRKLGCKIHPTISLGFFNFSRYRMWLDLDPANWPDQSALFEHPVIAALAERRAYYDPNEQSPIPSAEEVAEHQAQEDLPILLHADSSQYAALLAARNNTSITIIGPPGTGKSQTITNLIATALHEGKRVLFVAQKMAALNVVFSNLTKVGVSDFCLPLYTDKSRPVEVHQHFQKAEDARTKAPRSAASNSHLTAAAKRLNTVANGLSGIGVYGVNATVIRSANATRERAQQILGSEFSAESIQLSLPPTQIAVDAWKAQADHALREWRHLLDNTNDTWIGWSPIDLMASQVPQVMRSLRVCLEKVSDLKTALELIDPSLSEQSLASVKKSLLAIRAVPFIERPSPWIVSKIAAASGGDVKQVATLEALVKQYASHVSSATQSLPLRNEKPAEIVERLGPAVRQLTGGLVPGTRLAEAGSALDHINSVHLALETHRAIAGELPEGVQALGGLTWGTLHALTEFPHDAVPAIPRQLNQRVVAYLLAGGDAFTRIAELVSSLSSLRDHQLAISTSGIGLGNVDGAAQDSLAERLASLPRAAHTVQLSALEELAVSVADVVAAWHAISARTSPILPRLASPSVGALLALARTPFVSRALSLTEIDQPTVAAVCQGVLPLKKVPELASQLAAFQAIEVKFAQIRGRLAGNLDEQDEAVATIRGGLSTVPAWADRPLDDLRRDQEVMARIEQGRRGAVQVADQLLAAWGLPEATNHDHVTGAFATVEILRTFPSPVMPTQLGRWAELPIQATIEVIAETGRQLVQERDRLASHFLLSEAPDADAITALRRTFATQTGIFRWFSSSWRAARARLMRFCTAALPSTQELITLLDRLVAWKRAVAALDQDGIGAMALGAQWKGIDSNWAQAQQIFAWVRTLPREEAGSILRWFATTQVAGLPSTSTHIAALVSWKAWQSSTGNCESLTLLESQASAMSAAASRLGRIVTALDGLGAQAGVTPNQALEVIGAYTDSQFTAGGLKPFAVVLAGRTWNQVRVSSIEEARQWTSNLMAAGFTLQSCLDLVVGDARMTLRACRDAVAEIEAAHARVAARIGIEDARQASDVVATLEAIRTTMVGMRTTIALLHTQRETTLGTVADVLRSAQQVRAITTTIAPWSKELGQGFGSSDLDPVTVSTEWTRAVRANDVSVPLVQWIVAADAEHRATWWKRLAFSANQVKDTIETARTVGMLNIADATTDSPVATWHDHLPRSLAEWRSSLDLLSSAASTPVLTLSDLTRSLESHTQAAAVAREMATYDDRVGFRTTDLTPTMMRDHWLLVAQARELPSKLCAWLLGLGTRAALDHLKALSGIAESLFKATEEHVALAERFGKQTYEGPCGTCLFSQTVVQRRTALAQLSDAEASLLPFADLLRLERQLADDGLAQLLNTLRITRPSAEDMLAVFASLILYRQAEMVIQANPVLANFTGSRHQAERKEFAAHDLSMLEKNQARVIASVASRHVEAGRNSRVTADMTQRALLDKERSKQRKHFPIRKLVTRAGKAMQDLCPCWLMTPLAVAQYLSPGAIEFDLVVMDEASQLTPEDAFGAIARGREVVIVGDPAQMPPSNFFQSTTTNDVEEEDEEAEAAAAESILELAKASLPESGLIWHYRSQHQELIAPANAFSYNHRLIIFPSAVDRRDDRGIKHHYVPDGFFRNQVNTPEAGAVVGYLVKTLRSYAGIPPKKRATIGVLTMNARHQEAISNLLDQARQGDAIVAKILMEEESRGVEPLIVRNLENFQGDQRDIIVIACTYGPEYPGTDKVHQRFKSINGIAGKRRFNVAITRAKQQMVVFSSMRSEQILIGEGKNEGVVDFHRFLRYCETDRRVAVPDLGSRTGQSMDSPFEEAVAAFLRAEGYTIEPQVGVCGYFVDLGVRHPRDSGRFALGIECDGATYHSSRAARDRDHLREEILKERDWNLHRIWSTDWFYGQVKAKQVLLHAVKQACS